MTLTKEATYEEFQTTKFYTQMMKYLTTTPMPNREVFTQAEAEDMMNSMYWRCYWGENLEGIK